MKKTSKILSIALVIAIISMYFTVPSFSAGKKNYLLIGDSIAVGQGLSNSDEACYGRIVADTNGYNYANNAVSGTPSSVLLKMLDADYMVTDIKKANIITISIGANDYLTSNTVTLLLGGAMGIDSQFNKIQKSFAKNFAKIIEKIKSINSKAKILVQTVYNPCYNNLDYVYQKGVDGVNNTIKSYLKKNPGSFSIIDVESVFKGHEKEYVAADTLHPNSKGNLAIAKLTLSRLKSLKLGTKTTPVINHPGTDWTSNKTSNTIANIYNRFLNWIAKMFRTEN